MNETPPFRTRPPLRQKCDHVTQREPSEFNHEGREKKLPAAEPEEPEHLSVFSLREEVDHEFS